MYKSGFISTGVLNYVGDLSDERKQQMLEHLKTIGTKNKILPLPKDWELKTLNLSMVDAQYLEGRKLTMLQLASAFGVSPNQLNDYSKGSYANATAQQLAFLQSTLMYIARQFEDELTFKLLSDKEIKKGYRVDVDTDAVLQSTPDVLADILCKYVTGSIMTINEARDRAGLSPMPDGDKLMTMPGATTLKEEVVV
jgi:HK97 family phage portal protein